MVTSRVKKLNRGLRSADKVVRDMNKVVARKAMTVHFPNCECDFCNETLEEQIERERKERSGEA